jgi:hypothetical protein
LYFTSTSKGDKGMKEIKEKKGRVKDKGMKEPSLIEFQMSFSTSI